MEDEIERDGLETATEPNEEVSKAPKEQDDVTVNDDDVTDDLEDGENDEDGEGDDVSEDEEGDEDDPEFVTLERNGKAYKIPKDLENDFLKSENMDRDYTQSKQQLAEQRRALETQRQFVEQQASVSTERLTAASKVIAIEDQLAQYANVDWRALEDQDPLSANQHWRVYQQLKDQRDEAKRGLDTITAKESQLEQERVSRRLEETKQFAQKHIPNWSEAHYRNLLGYAEEIGVDPNKVHSVIDPILLRVLNDAYIGKQAREKASGAKPKPKEVKPGVRIAAKASPKPSNDLSRMSMEEYARARRKGVGG